MQPARILVIEDNPFDIVLLRHALDKQGEDYELEILSNGEEALRFVHEHRTRVREPEPCVILLDRYLRFMTVWLSCELIKTGSRGAAARSIDLGGSSGP